MVWRAADATWGRVKYTLWSHCVMLSAVHGWELSLWADIWDHNDFAGAPHLQSFMSIFSRLRVHSNTHWHIRSHIALSSQSSINCKRTTCIILKEKQETGKQQICIHVKSLGFDACQLNKCGVKAVIYPAYLCNTHKHKGTDWVQNGSISSVWFWF